MILELTGLYLKPGLEIKKLSDVFVSNITDFSNLTIQEYNELRKD